MSALESLPAVEEAAGTADPAALVAAGQPRILRGLVADWPAVTAGLAGALALTAYLKPMDAGLPGPVMETPASAAGRFGYAPGLAEFAFTKRQRPVSETLDRIERASGRADGPVTAIQMLPIASHLRGFVAANAMPLLPGVEPLLWLGGPVRTQIHNDRDHNLACVIAGRRRFLLFPPEQVGNLYIGPLETPPPLSLVNPEAPDVDRFPRFAEALNHAQVAELAPGDALFLPRLWWHHVTSRDPFNAMVNYWWGDRGGGLADPHTAFLAALLALKTLPPEERAYWQALFETHVFADDGADHLPPARRGMLGRPGPQALAALRQQLRAAALQT